MKDELQKNFVNPPRSYGLMPLWDLNNDLKSDDLRACLEEQARQGITGVFLHPRTGMEVEYLSPDYWRAIDESVRECKRLELETWLYDEYNWPSGVAGGRLLREHPEYRQVFLDYRRAECAPGETCEITIPPTAQVLVARAWRIESDQVLDISTALDGNILHWTAAQSSILNLQSPTTNLQSFSIIVLFTDHFPGRLWATNGAPWARNEVGALDYLNPDAVREFIHLTHEQYRERLGDEFGKQIRGIFTDEPATFYGWQWTPRFLQEFRARCGYDLLPHLHELLLPVGNYAKTRCDYHQIALDLYAASFFRQLGEWSVQNRLLFTGHLLYEDKLDFLPTGQGGVFATLRELQMPGIDYLGDRTGYEPTVLLAAPNLGPKTLSSLAHATNRPRALVELYGGNGWSTSLARYKNVLNWIEACGVNFICPHASYLSIKGHRKRDFPASHFVQNPWWRYYDIFAKYVARLSYLSSQGRHVADIAVLYPQRTFWVEHVLFDKSERFKSLTASFGKIGEALLRVQRDYDFLFEETLEEGTAKIEVVSPATFVSDETRRLKIGDESFSVVVLPPLTTIALGVMERLRDFVWTGGTLVALGQLPVHTTERRDDPRLADLLDTIFRLEDSRLEIGDSPSGRAVFVPVELSDNPNWIEIIRQQLDAVSLPDVQIESPFAREMIYQHRQIEGADFYFIANLSEHKGLCTITLRARGGVQVWNVERGTMSPIGVDELEDGRVQLSYHFHPGEAVWFVVSPSFHSLEQVVSQEQDREKVVELREWRIEPESPNCLLLDPWRVRVVKDGQEREMRTSRYDSLETLSRMSRGQAEAQGLDPSEWTFFMRVAREPASQMASSLFPPEGAEFERTTTVRCEFVPDDLALVYEDLGEPIEIRINDVEYRGKGEPCFVWDQANRQIPLSDLLRVGENTIAIRTRMPAYPSLPPGAHGLEPIILRGPFGVREGVVVAPETRITELVSWTELGYPNYSGAMAYRTQVEIPAEYIGRNLWLTGERVCETMEVVVNGQPAGVRVWEPYELDIGQFVRAGLNEITIIVTNTLSNLLTRPLPSGLIGEAEIRVR